MSVLFDRLEQSLIDSGRGYDTPRIRAAFELADKAHDGQFRRSGEPYIDHPVHVATLLFELGMDSDSVIAALLHDVVEDTETSLEYIAKQFGEDVAQMVDGVTKLGQMQYYTTREDVQAENVRKMLLAMNKDIRVILIKLCDRLHNMRTMDSMPPQKQRDKSLETMEVYAPIAHRLGISSIKEELEDLALKYLDPYGYEQIVNYLKQIEMDHYLSLSRNFGKEAAMYAGLKNAAGDYVTVMDADLQDPPAMLPQMVDLLNSGDCDCVATHRVDRAGEPKVRSFFARIFYKLMNRISDTELVTASATFE